MARWGNSLSANGLKMLRVWEMPNKWTFQLDSVRRLLQEEMGNDDDWVDPFAGVSSPARMQNDIDPESPAEFHFDGFDFLKSLAGNKFDGVLFDPPYSTEQALRSYKAKCKGTAGREEYHSRCKDEIARIIRVGGKAICFGWTSAGVGLNRGFRLERLLLVGHGAAHYDTIVTVETKVCHQQELEFSQNTS